MDVRAKSAVVAVLAVLVGNLIADVLGAVVDPRAGSATP